MFAGIPPNHPSWTEGVRPVQLGGYQIVFRNSEDEVQNELQGQKRNRAGDTRESVPDLSDRVLNVDMN